MEILIYIDFALTTLAVGGMFYMNRVRKNSAIKFDEVIEELSDEVEVLKQTTPRLKQTDKGEALILTPEGEEIHNYKLNSKQ